MTSPATNPLSFNLYVQQIGVLAVENTQTSGGVYSFVSAPLQTALPQMLNYAELRIQRDVDFLNAKSSNQYTFTQGNNIFALPVNDFLMPETLEILQLNGSTVVNASPLLPVSKEFIQNCYSSLVNAGQPKFFAPYGDTFADGADTSYNILLGPTPNYAYPLRVTGVIRLPSLYQFATSGPADTSYTYISQWLPDLLLMASMIYISAYQRNFSATADSPEMGQTYESQYRALLAGAVTEENRRKFLASAFSAYSVPVAATPNR